MAGDLIGPPLIFPPPSEPKLFAPGLWRRMACWLYEGLLIFSVVFMGGYLFGTLTQTRHGLENRHALQAFLFLLLGIYFVWFWHRGQTLAMKTWRIRLVDCQGQAVSEARAALRYLLCWSWFLPVGILPWYAKIPAVSSLLIAVTWVVIWSLLSRLHPERQFLHDALAGTRLVDTAPNS